MSKLHCLRSCKNLACREETHISRGCLQKVSLLSLKVSKKKKKERNQKKEKNTHTKN